jgi:hypothetical protein
MAAASKLTEQERREIVARRAKDESFSSIGARLGYPHSTIIRGHAKGLEEQAAELAEAEDERVWHERRQALWDGWTVDFGPYASGPLYPEPDYCDAYWENKMNGARPGRAYHNARLDYYSVRRGDLLEIEDKAQRAGRPLYLYPNGYPPRSEAAAKAAWRDGSRFLTGRE